MIILNKLNGTPFMLNDDLIETIDENPDTTIHLTTNRILIVKESMRDVIDLVVKYRREINLTQREARYGDDEGLV